MNKETYSFGQLMKSLDRAKNVGMSHKYSNERYVKRFNGTIKYFV